MDKLNVFFKSMSIAEKQGFRHYLRVKSFGKDNKRIFLVDLLIRGKTSEQVKKILAKKYDTTDNAYYQLKRVLIHELEKYILQHRVHLDHKSVVYQQLDLAQHFMDRLQYELAWNYLLEAEQVCQTNGFFEGLPIIHLLQLQICFQVPAYRKMVKPIVAKKKEVSELLLNVTTLFANWNNETGGFASKEILHPEMSDQWLDKNKNNVLFRKVSWLSKMKQHDPSQLLHYKNLVSECFSPQQASEMSIRNKLDWHLLLAQLHLQTGDKLASDLLLDKLEILIKTQESVPLQVVLDWYSLRVDQLIKNNKPHDAFQKAERVVGKYANLVPDSQKVILLLRLVNVGFLAEKHQETLTYITQLEALKDDYLTCFGQFNFYKLSLLKAVLYIELHEDDSFKRSILSLEKCISLRFYKRASELLHIWFETRHQLNEVSAQWETEATEFLREFPANNFDNQLPDFSIWLQAKLENQPLLKIALQLTRNPAAA